MNDPKNDGGADSSKQRDALMESEKNAHRNQPQNVKDEAVDDKVVDIKPDEAGRGSIQGLDTK